VRTDRSAFLLALFAVCCLALSIWLSPGSLIPLGILDASLTSDNPLTRATAHLEIKLAKVTLMSLGVIGIVAAVAYPLLTKMTTYRRFISRPDPFPNYSEHVRKFKTFSSFFTGLSIFLGVLYIKFGNDLFSSRTLTWINLEDGLLETLSAVILLIAAVVALIVAVRLRRTGYTGYRWMHGFLALLFFAMAGEEISWGQRYIGFETAAVFQELNVQNETNVHNMFGYIADHMFVLLVFVWGCIVPFVYVHFRFFRQVLTSLGLPIPCAGLAVGMLLITLMQEQITNPLLGQVYNLRVPELREFLSAIAFLFLMLDSFRFLRPRRSEAVAAAG